MCFEDEKQGEDKVEAAQCFLPSNCMPPNSEKHSVGDDINNIFC